jgi:hypothetical protein
MRKTVFIITLCGLIFAAGCNARRTETNEAAKKIVGILDRQYNSNVKKEPAKITDANQYCFAVSLNALSADKITQLLLENYRKSVKYDPVGHKIASKIEMLQTSLESCAYVRCKNTPGVDAATLGKAAGFLGIKPGAEPPADSCAQYKKLSTETNKLIEK